MSSEPAPGRNPTEGTSPDGSRPVTERHPSKAAARALQEARARNSDKFSPKNPPELEGRGGLDPVRYGDWEVKGLASDF